MKKKLIILTVFILCLAVPFGASALAFSKIVAFGDSLSDNGPYDGYGLGVWSNGDVWLEYVAAEMGAQLEDRAIGGAKTSGHVNYGDIYGLDWQIELYLSEAPMGADLSDVLFVIWAGGNDFLSMQPGDNPNLVIANAINNIQNAIDALLFSGAQNILVMNLPNLGAAPVNNWNPALSAGASALSQAFNQYLMMMLCSYLNVLPEHEFYMVDTYEMLDYVVANPGEFGFTNVTDSGGQNPPDGYLFWDPIHPTTAAHQVIAAAALGQVYHRNLSTDMKDLLRQLNDLRPRQPLEYDCELCFPAAP